MIVHRLLDAVFRTLDTVDAIRSRVDEVLGRAQAQPPSSWPAVIDDDTGIDARGVRAVYSPADSAVDGWAAAPGDDAADTTGSANDDAAAKTTRSQNAPLAPTKATTKATPKTTTKQAAPTKKAAATPAKATKKAAAKKAPTKKTAATTTTTTRKGSVDRLGRDLASPRATQVARFIADSQRSTVAEDAALDGKRTLARVLWAVAIAEEAGIVDGLTAVDASALLSTAAQVEVFSTNVARAFRDEHALFAETSPDGRSKRYALTAAGRARLAEVTLR